MHELALAPWTWLIIGLSCGFSFFGFQDRALMEKYLFWPEAILARREYYRLVTSGFLHANAWHLFMNMLTLYFFGPMIEMMCGGREFLTIYLASLIGGGLLSLYVHRHHDYRALGASGAISGVMFAHILFRPGGSIFSFFLPIGIPAWLYAIGFVLASFAGMYRPWNNVGHDAHLGGALVGLFTAAVLHPIAIRYSPWLFGALSIGTLLLVIFMARYPMFVPSDGLDFTKPRERSADQRRWFSWPAFLRRRKSAVANADPKWTERQLDALLQKVSEVGMENLTDEEKKALHQISELYRRREEKKKPNLGFPL